MSTTEFYGIPELVQEVLCHCLPADIVRMRKVSTVFRNVIQDRASQSIREALFITPTAPLITVPVTLKRSDVQVEVSFNPTFCAEYGTLLFPALDEGLKVYHNMLMTHPPLSALYINLAFVKRFHHSLSRYTRTVRIDSPRDQDGVRFRDILAWYETIHQEKHRGIPTELLCYCSLPKRFRSAQWRVDSYPNWHASSWDSTRASNDAIQDRLWKSGLFPEVQAPRLQFDAEQRFRDYMEDEEIVHQVPRPSAAASNAKVAFLKDE